MEDETQSTPANDESRWYGEGVDEGFLQALREARARTRTSQERLANGMKSLGFAWHQTTVAKTESGQRPLLFREAVALANLLRFDLSQTTQVAGTAVDKWLKNREIEVQELAATLASAEKAVDSARHRHERSKVGYDFFKAVRDFDKTHDATALLHTMAAIYSTYAYAYVHDQEVLDLLALPDVRNGSADLEARIQVLMIEDGLSRKEAEERMRSYSPRRSASFPGLMAIELVKAIAHNRGIKLSSDEEREIANLHKSVVDAAKRRNEFDAYTYSQVTGHE